MSYQKKGIDCLVEVPSLKLIGFKVLPTTSLILLSTLIHSVFEMD